MDPGMGETERFTDLLAPGVPEEELRLDTIFNVLVAMKAVEGGHPNSLSTYSREIRCVAGRCFIVGSDSVGGDSAHKGSGC